MRKFMVMILIIASIGMPNTAFAAFQMDFRVAKQFDGVLSGEFWYDNKMLWRVNLVPDGAQPVTCATAGKGISIFPDVKNGFMLLKVTFE